MDLKKIFVEAKKEEIDVIVTSRLIRSYLKCCFVEFYEGKSNTEDLYKRMRNLREILNNTELCMWYFRNLNRTIKEIEGKIRRKSGFKKLFWIMKGTVLRIFIKERWMQKFYYSIRELKRGICSNTKKYIKIVKK